MSRASTIAYHVVAILAMGAQIVIVGLLVLYANVQQPQHAPELAPVLKSVITLVWLGSGVVGLVAWGKQSRLVIAVPICSFVVEVLLIELGDATMGWTFTIGY